MAGGFCVRCGQPLAVHARFCPQCGRPVAGGAIPALGLGVSSPPEGDSHPPAAPASRRSFLRRPLGIVLIVVVVIGVVIAALATIPVDHSLHHSTPVSGPSTTFTTVDVWSWTFPSGTNVTIVWTGPTGISTNLTVLSTTGTLFSQSGTTGKFWFTASLFPYLFQVSVSNPGTVHGSVDVTASYWSPIL